MLAFYAVELDGMEAKCHICSTELSYLNKSTSSMLRHYRARHENEVPDTPRIDSASRKQMLDEALLSFILKDCQPLSIVESEGFRELVHALQSSCFANQKDHQTNGGQKVRGGTGTSEKGSTASCGNNLWQHLNIEVGRQTKSATADAIQEMQRYLAEGNIARGIWSTDNYTRCPILYSGAGIRFWFTYLCLHYAE
ncbi:uncharacterized protein KZ484_013406 [Pholidichthys leucotaenia]